MISDFNDPELSGKYLGTITTDFVKVCDVLKEASYQVRSKGFSEFTPSFPFRKKCNLSGKSSLAKRKKNLDWNYFITYMDEFVQRIDR
jgi:hypothetical protein